MTSAEAVDEIYTCMFSPMVTYKENATVDLPKALSALNEILRYCHRLSATRGDSERAHEMRDIADNIRDIIREELTKDGND